MSKRHKHGATHKSLLFLGTNWNVLRVWGNGQRRMYVLQSMEADKTVIPVRATVSQRTIDQNQHFPRQPYVAAA